MQTINGKDVLLAIHNGTDYIPYLCSTDCSISIKPELIPVTTLGNGRGTKRRVRRIEWSVSFSGISATVSDTEAMFVFDFANPANIIQEIQIRLSFTDGAGNSKSFYGYVLTESIEISGGADDFSSFEHGLVGNGMYSIVTEILSTPALGDADSILIDATDTTTIITSATLVGKTLLGVSRAGRWYAVITSGTPAATEVKFNSATGSLTFSDPFAIGEQTFVIYK